MIRVAIAGGSGYVGGELLRLLLWHPEVEVVAVTSERRAGQYVAATHPNLRGWTDLRFVPLAELTPCDVLFTALPHGYAAEQIEHLCTLAPRLIDCSADFRLDDADAYREWYGREHPAPQWLGRFAYGLPEANREAIREARYVSGVGCNATAVNLALLPLVRAGLLDPARPIIADVKVGSSEGGDRASESSHHPERSHVVRSFAPTGHRHTAEVRQVLGVDAELSVTSVELVRGALATVHAWLREPLEDRQLWKAYRAAYGAEPFVRIVHEKGGNYRHPEPKILAGTNLTDVGWSVDPRTGRVVALCAIDNLMKGAAGTAVQALNLTHGWPEQTGLRLIGLHPV
ncbi:N-acetyl-gamma-glutamyl-phosphate/LysW-gamma-L-alpha-aminoadipyl-6-phosphate reductase [Deinococcus sp. HSC-46F16]|uniref:N-acetyl-gamma-glutamyl-phosphate reductase n=1 Tax=Deinococcus sp. HSC-46F16 TaxID=2910968 RepID=UPI00209FD80C|nr:N-acetyl-gamma-glutamyl-phosphate reductase [Deinococcus sp. HSC-46F16]MCP2014625.1 N-acetyl-gamma-glutamyl-phosphate/LysW-gamma-L-alpha-aminoadipyl-6-phosphate reductase [Deinococcus sp. HSC-46F16]